MGRHQLLHFLVDCVYAFDNALRALVSKVWVGASMIGRSTQQAHRHRAGESIRSRLYQYYSKQPYEVVYHCVGVFFLAWLAWEQAMKLRLQQLQSVMKATVMTPAQVANGKVWTLLTGPFVQPDAPEAAMQAVLGVLYGTRVVTYVGPWYALRLAAGGIAASTAAFLAATGAVSAFQNNTQPHERAQAAVAASSRPTGYQPSTEAGLTMGQRAFNILKYGTHEAPSDEPQPTAGPKSFADSLAQFPHVGPSGAVSALAGFAIAAKPSASWSLWRNVRVPVPLPAVVVVAFAVGSAAASPASESVSNFSHLVGGGLAGAAWFWGLRSGRLQYTRFWPK